MKSEDRMVFTLSMKDFEFCFAIITFYMNFYWGMMDKLAQTATIEQRQTLMKMAQPAEQARGEHMNLDQVLRSQNLINTEETETREKFKRAVFKLMDSKIFQSEYLIDFKLKAKSVEFHFLDDLNFPVLSFTLDDIDYVFKSFQFDIGDMSRMERFFIYDKQKDPADQVVKAPFFYQKATCDFSSSYSQMNTLQKEPFIEHFPMEFTLEQTSPLSKIVTKVNSPNMLNINFTYGFACTLQNFFKKIARLHMHHTGDPKEDEENELGTVVNNMNMGIVGIMNRSKTQRENEILRKMREKGETDPEAAMGHRETVQLLNNSVLIDAKHGAFKSDDDLTFFQDIEIRQTHTIQFHNHLGIPLHLCSFLDGHFLDNLEKVTDEYKKEKFIILQPNEKFIIRNEDFQKIDFKVEGFQRVRKIYLEKTGCFGIYLFKVEWSKPSMDATSRISMVMRIRRSGKEDRTMFEVYFESSILMLNNTNIRLQISSVIGKDKKASGKKKESDVRWELDPKGGTQTIPLDIVLRRNSQIMLRKNKDEKQELFHDILGKLDPRIQSPAHDPSKIVVVHEHFKEGDKELNWDKYIAMDVFYMKTRTEHSYPAGQFLIAFNPVYTLKNMLFTDLMLYKHVDGVQKHIVDAPTRGVTWLYDFNTSAKEGLLTEMQFKYDEHTNFSTGPYQFGGKVAEIKKDKVSGAQSFTQKFSRVGPLLNPSDEQDCELAFHVHPSVGILPETDYDNFLLRSMYYARTKSYLLHVLHPYIIVNQTSRNISCFGKDIPRFSNRFVNPIGTKSRIQVQGYYPSNKFTIKTLGVSGVLKVQADKKTPEEKLEKLENGRVIKQLEVGTFISYCPFPYTSTHVVKIVPRYIITSKLKTPIVLREMTKGTSFAVLPGSEVYYHFDDSKNCQFRLRAFQKSEFEEESKKVTLDMNYENDTEKWSPKFSVKDADDFQVTIPFDRIMSGIYKLPERKQSEEKKSKVVDRMDTIPRDDRIGLDHEVWSETEAKKFVRITVSPGEEHTATLFVVLTRPISPEFVFYNHTIYSFSFFHKGKGQVERIEELKVEPEGKMPFTLDPLAKDDDYLSINISGHNIIYEIDSTKKRFQLQLPKDPKKPDGEQAKVTFMLTTTNAGNLRFIKLVVDTSIQKRKSFLSKFSSNFIKKEEEEKKEHRVMLEKKKLRGSIKQQTYRLAMSGQSLLETWETKLDVKIGGLGISIVNFQPQELLYISKYLLTFNQTTIFVKRGFYEETFSDIKFRMKHMQVDNASLRTFPCIVSPEAILNKNPREQDRDTDDGVHYLQFRLAKTSVAERKIATNHVHYFQFLLQKTRVQIHQFVIEQILLFLASFQQLVTDELINEFQECEAIDQYNKMMLSFTPPVPEQAPAATEQEAPVKQFSLVNSGKSDGASPQAFGSFAAQKGANLNQSGKGTVGPESVHIAINEEEAEESIEDGFKHTHEEKKEEMKQEESVHFSTEGENDKAINEFRMSPGKASPSKASVAQSKLKKEERKFQTKEELCPFITSQRMELPKDQVVNANKIFVEKLEIFAISLIITLRLKKREVSNNPLGPLMILINLLSTFANVTEAEIYFSEKKMSNIYNIPANISGAIIRHYVVQGVVQLYSILGSSDILGNPAGLLKNVGRGFKELYTQPYKGLLKGPKQAIQGIYHGVKAFVTNVTGGVFGSVSRMSGSLYLAIGNSTGREFSESNLDDPDNAVTGLAAGSYGVVAEIGRGLTGIITQPIKRTKKSGCACIPITKGIAQGLLALILFPLLAALRLIHAFFTGFKNCCKGKPKLNKRFRFPRYITPNDVLLPYDNAKAEANLVLHRLYDGAYVDEDIIDAVDTSVLILTDHRVLQVENQTKVLANTQLCDIQTIQDDQSSLSKCFYLETKKGNKVKINTQGMTRQQVKDFIGKVKQAQKSYERYPIVRKTRKCCWKVFKK